MPLSPPTGFTVLTDQQVLASLAGADLRVTWTTPYGPGTWYQVYLDGTLSWWGLETSANLPYPNGPTNIVVAAVPADDATVSYSASIEIPNQTITLTWYGGRYLGQNISGYNIYMGDGPGAAVDYSKIIAFVQAFQPGQPLDGYGRGGYGRGGYGSAGLSYTWTSASVATGVWNVAIKSVDVFGNVGTSAATASVTVDGPPLPPALFPDGTRLHLTYNQTTHEATLTWNPSPTP